MVLGPVLERFIQDAPMPLMFRALLERALDPAELDAMFEATATKQYTRELLFSAIVDLLAVVVFRMQPSVRHASWRSCAGSRVSDPRPCRATR